jgi:hypothetical protein
MSAPDLTAQRFWDGFDAARSEARAKAQTPLGALFASAPFRAAIASITKPHSRTALTERERIALAWAAGDRDAVDRPTPTESSPLESTSSGRAPTLH